MLHYQTCLTANKYHISQCLDAESGWHDAGVLDDRPGDQAENQNQLRNTHTKNNVLLEYVFQKEATFIKQCHDSVNMLQHSDTRAKYIAGRLEVSWGKGKSFNFGVHLPLQAQEKSWTTTAVEYRCRIWTVR